MRATLGDPSLVRYAGQFVWLELDFDNPRNAAFLVAHGVTVTPTEYVLDPATERATATQLGAMTARELASFLERGASTGDALLASAQPAAAADAYAAALRGDPPDRAHVVGALAGLLQTLQRDRECVDLALAEAPRMPRSEDFGRTVMAGLQCAKHASLDPGALVALATEAVALPSTVRDHRFSLYRALIPHDRAWGDRWLAELDATHPASDDERTALDIARVEAADALDAPARVIPALIDSERAMPNSYVASLRLAQMLAAAQRYPDALAACERGLARTPGPLGRSWLLQIEGDVFTKTSRRDDARRALEAALAAAREIASPEMRDHNAVKIAKTLSDL